jgi:Tol biopolymer transport system component
MRRLLLFLILIMASCTRKQPYSDIKLGAIHTPSNQLLSSELAQYDIAYCWTPFEQPKNDPEDLEVDIVLSRADGDLSSVVSTRNLKIYQSPFIEKEQEGHPENFDLGCFSASGFNIRYSGNELFWTVKSDELGFVAGINPQTADFRMLAVAEDMAFTESEMPSPYDYSTLFSWPRGVFWSPDGQRFALLGLDSPLQSHGNNIWVYDMVQQEFRRITKFVETGNDVATASWSSDGTRLAIGYGGPESGLSIAEYGGSQSYIEISSRTNSALLDTWSYWVDSSWVNFFRAISKKDSTENFTSELVFNSTPVWVNNDQNIIFTAANKRGKATLFIVNADGTSLRELLPGLPGIALMPRISPDRTTLAFVRFPDWNDRSRAELALLDLESMQINSLAVFPRLSDESILFISGMDWSPDSKYLAFSAPYHGESDVFIVTRDGNSWLNLTEDRVGDAVSPAWKQ